MNTLRLRESPVGVFWFFGVFFFCQTNTEYDGGKKKRLLTNWSQQNDKLYMLGMLYAAPNKIGANRFTIDFINMEQARRTNDQP